MSQCESCHSGCCRSFAVPITGADILKVERDQGIGFWDFVCRWADPQGEIAQRYAPHFHFADEPETPWVIGLKHVPSAIDSRTTKCQFLVEEPASAEYPLGRGTCGIYESRPQTCRAFPSKLNDSSELAIICKVPEHVRDDEADLYKLCPRPWEPSDFDPVSTIQDLVVCQHEMKFFRSLATLWNQNLGEWELFPEFLRIVYTNRIRPAEEETTEEIVSIPFPGLEERELRRAA